MHNKIGLQSAKDIDDAVVALQSVIYIFVGLVKLDELAGKLFYVA